MQSKKILNVVYGIYNNHDVAIGKKLIISKESENIEFTTDVTLLIRVIGNLVKNALGASDKNQAVTVGCHKEKDEIIYWIHNSTFMPEKVKLQIFKRSFSTKGKGRGLGTYSIKLLTEQYLQGKVYFGTSEEEGTTFYIKYPINIDIDKKIEKNRIKNQYVIDSRLSG